jgi:hypothetical protein
MANPFKVGTMEHDMFNQMPTGNPDFIAFLKKCVIDAVKNDPATQLIREALDIRASRSRCEVCKGPATRQALQHIPLFCDEHGLHDLIRLGEESDIHYRDLRNADWVRKAIALLKRRDGNC